MLHNEHNQDKKVANVPHLASLFVMYSFVISLTSTLLVMGISPCDTTIDSLTYTIHGTTKHTERSLRNCVDWQDR